jgi:ornithine cyclodeaminase/alanine dehydrogenase-like protein (mu-crystallin family)
MLNNAAMSDTLILSRSDVAKLLTIEECMDAVESAFKMFAEGKVDPPKVLGLHASHGGLHIKAGAMKLKSNYIIAKMNSNFPGNPGKFNLPTIQGAIAVFNADNGTLLALIDSIEITILRTGAATGIASKYLSKPKSETITIYGCGNQGQVSFHAIAANRNLKIAYLYDTSRAQAESLSKYITHLGKGIKVICVDDAKSALKESDIIVTCTPSRTPILHLEDVAPGTFIAAVGCDSEDKNEIHPLLISAAKVVSDFTEQCAAFGDLHHAIEQGLVTKSHVHAELGQIISGHKTGRDNGKEVIVFDSTGTALQDVAAASIVYEKAISQGLGIRFNFQH